MIKRVAALVCCLSLAQSSVVAAEDLMTNAQAGVAARLAKAATHDGPLRRASLDSGSTLTIPRDQVKWTARTSQDNGQARKRNWMERHPVIAGALIGFGTGVAITYLVAMKDKDEVLKVISPGAAATFWGGVSAGVGALAGWGIGRNRDDDGS